MESQELPSKKVEPTVYIYVLIDPRTSAIRYVGLTRDVAKRLSRYVRPHTKHLCNWFSSLKSFGLHPRLEVVDTVLESASSECERKWISYYRSEGCDLLNYTDGGERGYAITDEYRRHLSEGQRRWKRGPISEAHKQALSRANKGIMRNPGVRELCRKNGEKQRGIPLTAEHRQRVSEGVRRAMTPEVRKRMSDSHKGKCPHPMTEEMKRKISESLKRRFKKES